jgi:hypothetical protein
MNRQAVEKITAWAVVVISGIITLVMCRLYIFPWMLTEWDKLPK